VVFAYWLDSGALKLNLIGGYISSVLIGTIVPIEI